jgi:hypothetical protein
MALLPALLRVPMALSPSVRTFLTQSETPVLLAPSIKARMMAVSRGEDRPEVKRIVADSTILCRLG